MPLLCLPVRCHTWLSETFWDSIQLQDSVMVAPHSDFGCYLVFALQLYSPLPHAVLNHIHRWIRDLICWISNVLMRVNMTVIRCLCAEGRTICLCAWIRRPTQEVCTILDFLSVVCSLFDRRRHFRFVLFIRSSVCWRSPWRNWD